MEKKNNNSTLQLHKTASELERELKNLKAEFAQYKKYTKRELENPGVTIVLTVLLLILGGMMAGYMQYGDLLSSLMK